MPPEGIDSVLARQAPGMIAATIRQASHRWSLGEFLGAAVRGHLFGMNYPVPRYLLYPLLRGAPEVDTVLPAPPWALLAVHRLLRKKKVTEEETAKGEEETCAICFETVTEEEAVEELEEDEEDKEEEEEEER